MAKEGHFTQAESALAELSIQLMLTQALKHQFEVDQVLLRCPTVNQQVI
jgi:hypothetical protein